MICKNCKGLGVVYSAYIYPSYKIEVPCPVCDGRGRILFNKKIDEKNYRMDNSIAISKKWNT